MSRRALAGLGLCALALAALLRPAPAEPGRRSWVGALGASLGGLRVVAANALYLRAERLEGLGRLEDAAGALDLLLELDPHNEAGTCFLVDVYARALLPQVRGSAARLAWWRAARGLLERALAEAPDSARLHLAAADLWLLPSPAVLDALDVAEPRRIDRGVDHLVEAARRAAEIARAGRRHLVTLFHLGPYLVARRLADGETEAGRGLRRELDALARRHGAVLAEVLFDAQAVPADLTLAAAWARTRDVLEAAEAALAPGAPAGARNRAREAAGALRAVLGPAGEDLGRELARALGGT